MNRKTLTLAFLIALAGTAFLPVPEAAAQRTSRIYRPCPTIPPTPPARVEVTNSSRIDIRTCSVLTGEANISTGIVRLGDADGENGSTRIILDDTARTIEMSALNGTTVGDLSASQLNLTGFLNFSNPSGNGILLARTVTPAGTTGNRTINAMAGSVNFAAGTSSITVSNVIAAATSLVFCTIQTNDATATSCRVTDKGAGTFSIRLNANATAETAVAFWVTN